jgi:hypothetical protein
MEGKSIADFGLEDVEIGPSTAPTATMPVPTYWDIQRVVTENLDSIIADIHQSESAHQQRLHQNFRSYMSDTKKENQDFESHHSSFLDRINVKSQAVKQAVKRTVVSFGTNFVVINATLSKVEENTTRMSGLLETSCTQLHQLHDNEAARVTAMQEHHDRLDNMDAMLIRVTESVTKTMNLAHEMDSKILASRPTSTTDHQRPVDCPLAPGFVSPARPLANDMPHSSLVNSVPNHSFTPPNSLATGRPHPSSVDSVPDYSFILPSSPALHHFSHVRLGPVLRASSYPSGNRSGILDEPPTDSAYKSSASTHRPPPVDTLDLADDPCQGGCIASPRPSNKERQARQMRMNLFDIAGLVSQQYHGEMDGVTKLSISFIHTCGYQLFLIETPDDVLLCYCDIQRVHKKVRQGWFNPCSHSYGPSAKRILERGHLIFPRLDSLTAAEVLTFYNKLQELLAEYLIPLMPFDAIRLEFNFEGLFIPGLGTDRYADCTSALMEILPRLLPPANSEVQAKISAVCSELKNGYDLFWCILELAIPGFHPTVPIKQPRWTRDTDILKFCHGHELYFRLLAKKNTFYDSWSRTNMFLRGIALSAYADIITMLKSNIDMYRHADDDGFLPQHLCLNGIATMLSANAKAHVHDIGTPQLHMTRGFALDLDSVDEDELPYCHVKGYCPWVFCIEQGNNRTPAGRYNDCSAGMRDGRAFD